MKKAKFKVSQEIIKHIIQEPILKEERPEGTCISTGLFDNTHVLRVVYREEYGKIIVITFYPGRRKRYEI